MVDGKQVKVDNWGIFFLQRLQQFYKKTFFCDLTLEFEDNVQVKVHRLVMNACTEYFQHLENSCDNKRDYILMPSNLPSDVVIPIINFMYSGILEFQESSFDRLYATAKLMNMSVLTKLLDAQKTPLKPITPAPKRIQSVTPITWNLQGKKIVTKSFTEPDLPETLPGRKLPIWKRKSAPTSNPFLSVNTSYETYSKPYRSIIEEQPKPTRFEWPDEDNSSFIEPFDEISYMSKPLILPMKEKSPRPSTSSTFEEIKRTAGPVKRSGSPIQTSPCKKVNMQDVKEYLKEHKIRSDYIDYDDSEITDNDLQTFDNDDSNEEYSKDCETQEESPSKSILKSETSTSSSNKHVRFSLEGKENANTKLQLTPAKIQPKSQGKSEQNIDMSKHTKIITEVLKKYPHLVKNNKNIRLKILAKGNNSPNVKPTKAQLATAKQTSKVQYMVRKPDNQKPNTNSDKNSEAGPWECTRCDEPKQFSTYHLYRQHLTEAHNEKQDSQMCILCGHTSRKQNMLFYHKYIKHNIPPPAMYNFPKCKECSYIALSPALLLKHQLTHSATGLICNECGVSFINKQTLITHLQNSGHSQEKPTSHTCNFCDMSFISDTVLNQHIQSTHENNPEIKEEIDELSEKSKEKIKILSDVKVNTSLPTTLVPVRTTPTNKNETHTVPEPLEPSSEAEALSNVASGIAASLGLVDTIVVLDDQQYILQSTQHADMQENMLNTEQNYILPDMQMPDLISANNIEDQPVTLSENTVLTTQSISKANITSTDELVMVLTDHDYSDAANNTVITDNNIVVLYSHPVQTQATMMINSETGMIEVGKNYTVTSEIPVSEQDVNCEESIEMIQQEINNQIEENPTEIQYVQQEKLEIDQPISESYQNVVILDETSGQIIQETQKIDNPTILSSTIEESMDMIPEKESSVMEESIEMIQDELNKNTENQEINQNVQAKEIDKTIEETNERISNQYTEEEINEEIIPDLTQEENTQPTMIITDQNEEIPIESAPEILTEKGNTEVIPTEETENLEQSNITENVEQESEEIQNTIQESQIEENISIIENVTEENTLEVKHPENIENCQIQSKETESEQLQSEEIQPAEFQLQEMQPEEIQSDEIQTEETQNSEIKEDTDVRININQDSTDETELSNKEQIINLPSDVTQSNESQEKTSGNSQTPENISESCDSAFETPDKKLENTQEIETVPDITINKTISESTIVQSIDSEGNESNDTQNELTITEKTEENDLSHEKISTLQNEKISKLLDDWDDGDTDSQQSFSKSVPSTTSNSGNSINKLIDDWEDDDT